MKKLLFLMSLSIMAVTSSAQGKKLWQQTTGKVSFYSEAPVENIEAASNKINSVIDPASMAFAYTVPMKSFTFDKSLMQEHFNEKYVESDKYPNGTFKGKINETVDFSKNGTYNVTATGKLNIHGVEQQRTMKGTITVKDGTVTINSAFQVKLKDHNIEIPSLLFQNIAEVIDVKMQASYKLTQK